MSTYSLPPTPKRWQFRLWHLFALMTYVAVVIAVAKRWGIETLPVTIGLGIAWLNYGGALWFLQHGKPQLATLFIAWGVFLVSLFLPTHTVLGAPGWLAAWAVLCAPLGAVTHQEGRELVKLLCWTPLIDAANLLQLLLPFTAVRLYMGRGKCLAAMNCISMVAVWALAGPTAASGYILWCASFLLTLTAFPLNRATLLLIHVTLAGQVVVQLTIGFRI